MHPDIEFPVWDKYLSRCMEARGYNIHQVDMSRDLRLFSERRVSLDSEEFKRRWSIVQTSSFLITRRPLRQEEWQYLINILTHADVSRIEHMMLFGLSRDGTDEDITKAHGQLHFVLSLRDFSALETLVLGPLTIGSQLDNWRVPDLRNDFLGDLIRGAGLKNLRTLRIPYHNGSRILNALTESRVVQLTSFQISLKGLEDCSALDTTFKSGRLKGLRYLYLMIFHGNDFFEVFMTAIKSGNLRSLTSLRLSDMKLRDNDLAGLFRESNEWFASLETLALNGCGITSDQVCSLVDAVMEVPKIELALTTFHLLSSSLDDRTVDALVRLADSHRLPQLQVLDLYSSNGDGMSKALLALIQSLRKGHLPSLRKLDWGGNSVLEADAKAVVQAYFADQSLTTEIIGIDWDRYSDRSLETKLKTYRDRNLRLPALRAKLVEDVGDFVPLTSAKVFLCGFPEVGKTTLRKALHPSLGIWTKFMWKTRSHNFTEPRTRGIEISRMEAKKNSGRNTTLVVWDLAGQEEYHVLHGTFLPDSGLAGGKATTFILVFRASFDTDGTEKLWYWLRFVASSSRGLVKRHVVIVLNRFDNKTCTQNDQTSWNAWIKYFATMFKDSLDIDLVPFIIDVRKAALVQPLKHHLFNHAKALLQDDYVPGICTELQKELKGWSEGENKNHLPILTWQAFEERWKLKSEGNHFSVGALKIAASYLHEMGEIIYFEKEEEEHSGNKSILIPDPEWFCRKVVGELLLPKEMLEGGSSIEVRDDGSIPVILFKAFFQDLLVEGTHCEDVLSMLELVGLCYKKTEEEIIVPALIRTDDYSSVEWDGQGFHGVMGRCLVTKDKDTNIIPLILFRRLQVELAQDPDFGGRGDSGYRVGKSFSSFKVGALLILIQFDVDHSDPTDDRIDILAKSAMRGDPGKVRSAQVQCICEIMQKLEDLCAVCCDGLIYDIKVIEPSSAADRTDKMSERKFMSLQGIKDLIIKGVEYLSWQVDGHNMEPESCLSEKELERLVGTVQRDYDECRQDAVTMGLLPKDSLQEIEAIEEKNSYNACYDGNDQEGLTTKIFQEGIQEVVAVVREEGRHTRQHIEKTSTEILLEFRHRHELLVKHIQAQQSFSFEESGTSVPRYMFLLKKQDQPLIRLKAAVQSTYQLHLLCESHFETGLLHEVKDQKGIELTKTKDWLVKVSPWLRRSLQVLVFVGKTAANVYLPGVSSLIPDISAPNGSEGSAKMVDRAVKMLLDEHKEIGQSPDSDGNLGAPKKPISLNERWIAEGVVNDLIKELGYAVFAEKIRLKEVLLRATGVGSSNQAQPSVLWICEDCYKSYGEGRATAIPFRR